MHQDWVKDFENDLDKHKVSHILVPNRTDTWIFTDGTRRQHKYDLKDKYLEDVIFKMSYSPAIGSLAKEYHEICREMVNKQIGMITKPTQPYIEWDNLTEEQKKGRTFIAEELLKKYIMVRKEPVN
jgi:hypothetical protein